MNLYIKGNYSKSIFAADDYIIGLFRIKETNIDEIKSYVNKIITFTGHFHELNKDDLYCFYGQIINHPKYGLQFQVENYERLKPTDIDGLIAFLSSDLFKGVGNKLAKSIVELLGKNALDEILKDETCLLLVPKMTEKKAHKIYETLVKYEESHQMIVYLTELGFTMKDALRIYNVYKKETISKIEYNPYKLIEDVEINFLKVDEIALKFKIANNDERRIKACIIYIMEKIIYSNSDTYLNYEEIKQGVLNYLKEDIPNFDLLLEELLDENKIILLANKYYLKNIYDSEANVAKEISYLLKKRFSKSNLDEAIKKLENENNIYYNEEQKEAIKKALNNNITIITGGPGTGKTTIIKAICELYIKINCLKNKDINDKIALLAPTGRASKRISESTSLPASTIHRFLKWNKETNEFSINEYNKNFHNLIIIDEVSMIDLKLLDSLFRGLTRNIKLILVGDHHQLPSVGPGNVLKDLIESKLIDTVYLNILYRQDENSYIPTLAQEIKDNQLNNNFLETKSDYTFLRCNSSTIKESLKNICQKLVDKGYNYKRVQIMAPMYAGVNGIDNLNKELQEVFNPYDKSKNEIKYGDVIYRENDKVLQLVNLPEENIYNGDIGVIKSILKFDHKTIIYIDFDGNVVEYEPKDLNKITHGFIISIHKSQGSEFELIIMILCNSFKRMLYRKLIYTGITRAKKKLILIGEVDSFIYAVNNDNELIRKTNLQEQLKNNIVNIG